MDVIKLFIMHFRQLLSSIKIAPPANDFIIVMKLPVGQLKNNSKYFGVFKKWR